MTALSMQDARLIAKHIDTMDVELLTDAYVGIAKLKADVSDPERRQLDTILFRILALIKQQKESV
jgi:hypothetical protein